MATDFNRLSSNLGASIYEGCIIFRFIFLFTFGGHSVHLAYFVHKMAIKCQTSIFNIPFSIATGSRRTSQPAR